MRLGKATLFVANQGILDALPEHKFKDLAAETEAVNERNKALAAEIKAASTGMFARARTPCPARDVKRGVQRHIVHIYAANRAWADIFRISDFTNPQSWRKSRTHPPTLS